MEEGQKNAMEKRDAEARPGAAEHPWIALADQGSDIDEAAKRRDVPCVSFLIDIGSPACVGCFHRRQDMIDHVLPLQMASPLKENAAIKNR